MKKVGLAYPIFAIYNDSTGVPVYTNGTIMAKAIKYSIKYNKNDTRLDADDAIDEIDSSITSAEETLDINELLIDIRALLLGHTYSNNGISIAKDDIAPYVGHGLYTKFKTNGVYKYAAVWFYKIKFAEPDESGETQGEKITFQTPSLVGTAMFAINNKLQEIKVFDTAADAVAWLNSLAGIPVSASAGLSGLTMNGTGGTLSPSFGTSNRYYTFGGFTGTSLTVMATATNHIIQLYVDDVLNQTLTSGVASSAISMSVIGTKKLKIVAFEAGKQSQITEIIVVKTA